MLNTTQPYIALDHLNIVLRTPPQKYYSFLTFGAKVKTSPDKLVMKADQLMPFKIAKSRTVYKSIMIEQSS